MGLPQSSAEAKTVLKPLSPQAMTLPPPADAEILAEFPMLFGLKPFTEELALSIVPFKFTPSPKQVKAITEMECGNPLIVGAALF